MKNSRRPALLMRALAPQRKKIDAADRALLRALARRLAAVRAIGVIKTAHKLPLVQQARWQELVADRLAQGDGLGLSGPFVRAILSVIHREALRIQTAQRRTTKRKKL